MPKDEVGFAQHENHSYYPVYKTRKGNFYWRCLDCGEVRFFAHLNKNNCNHNLQLQPTKNGKYLYFSCPICRIRMFRPIQQDMTIPSS